MHYLEWCRIREEKPMLRSAFRDKCREVFDVTAANRATGTQLIP